MNKYLSVIAEAMGRNSTDIKDMIPMKKGMSNRTYLFTLDNKQYVLRAPGLGTRKIIDRQNECDVYGVLKDKGISENVVYISAASGYKISEYLTNARSCNPSDINDVRASMRFLRDIHQREFSVNHSIDIFERIGMYESLLEGRPSSFTDYHDTKEKIFKLKEIINMLPKGLSLAHMDAVPDNFLFIGDEIRLIDWEYAAMHDPHVDIAMFALHSMYDREQVEKLIGFYFTEGCPYEIRVKIYCYIAACGLLCSNWCEYKSLYGAEFGVYSLMQYAYAKEYFEIAINS
jgi:thiamine kinase-like enzyme